MKEENTIKRTMILNRIQCINCGDIITSYHRHDYITCKCGNISIDGGNDYRRLIYKENKNYNDLSIYSDAPFGILRESIHRGGRGKDNKQPLTWVPIYKMSNEWLKNCIIYNIERGLQDSFHSKMYKKELKYREENNIFIKD